MKKPDILLLTLTGEVFKSLFQCMLLWSLHSLYPNNNLRSFHTKKSPRLWSLTLPTPNSLVIPWLPMLSRNSCSRLRHCPAPCDAPCVQLHPALLLPAQLSQSCQSSVPQPQCQAVLAGTAPSTAVTPVSYTHSCPKISSWKSLLVLLEELKINGQRMEHFFKQEFLYCSCILVAVEKKI